MLFLQSLPEKLTFEKSKVYLRVWLQDHADLTAHRGTNSSIIDIPISRWHLMSCIHRVDSVIRKSELQQTVADPTVPLPQTSPVMCLLSFSLPLLSSESNSSLSDTKNCCWEVSLHEGHSGRFFWCPVSLCIQTTGNHMISSEVSVSSFSTGPWKWLKVFWPRTHWQVDRWSLRLNKTFQF